MAWAVKSPPLGRDSVISKKARVELIADTGRGIEETGVLSSGRRGEIFKSSTNDQRPYKHRDGNGT